MKSAIGWSAVALYALATVALVAGVDSRDVALIFGSALALDASRAFGRKKDDHQ